MLFDGRNLEYSDTIREVGSAMWWGRTDAPEFSLIAQGSDVVVAERGWKAQPAIRDGPLATGGVRPALQLHSLPASHGSSR